MSPESDANRILATRCTLPVQGCGEGQCAKTWVKYAKVSSVGGILDSVVKSIHWLNQQLLSPSLVDNSVWNPPSFSLFRRSVWWLRGGKLQSCLSCGVSLSAVCQWLRPEGCVPSKDFQCCPLNSDEAKHSTFGMEPPNKEKKYLFVFRMMLWQNVTNDGHKMVKKK